MNRTGPIVLSVLLLAAGGLGASAGPSEPPRLVRDLRVEPGPSQPEIPPSVLELHTLGTVTVFTGWDGVHGWELWRSDGTTEGTTLLADICPGHCSSSPFDFRDALGSLYFAAADPDHGLELWRTDGTSKGTELVADVVPGVESSWPQAFAELQGEIYFQAWTPEFGAELWATDGGAGGLRMVADIRPGPEGSKPLSLFTVGSTLYFSADDGTTGREPWKTDGQASGTEQVADLCPGSADSVWYDQPGPWGPRVFNAVGSRLTMAVSEGSSCTPGLLVSDGTAAGTERVPGLGESFLFQGHAPDGAVLFAGEGPEGGELWRTDGTVAGTALVLDINPTADSSPDLIGATRSAVYFSAWDGVHGVELWRTDGTAKGTALVRDIAPGSASGIRLNFYPDGRAVDDGTFLFIADDGVHGRELWVTDGTESGTQLTRDVNAGPADSFKDLFSLVFPAVLGDSALRMSFDGLRGWALWRSDGSAAGTQLVRDLDPGVSSAPTTIYGEVLLGWSTPKAVTENGVVWRARDDEHGVEAWVSDGTTIHTRRLVDACTGTCEDLDVAIGRPAVAAVGGSVFFSSWDGEYPEDLWATDGTPAGSHLVAEDLAVERIVSWSGAPGGPAALLTGGGAWLSDATPEGTVQLTPDWSADPTPLGAVALFASAQGGGGELRSTDGTPEGTVAIQSFDGGPVGLTALNATEAFFWADDGTTGLEPWVTDGTAPGTVALPEIRVGPEGSIPPDSRVEPLAMGGSAFFPADDGSTGQELWITDGTPRGTHSLGDLNPGPSGSDPRPLIVWGSRLYFSAFDAAHGRELWSTDGSPEGTTRVADLRPGPSSALADALPAYSFLFPDLPPAVWNGRLYFAATDGATGVELWSTGGTEGTTQVADLNPGPGSSSPNGFAVYEDQLFFTATDGVHGYELWALGDAPAEVVFEDGFESGDASAWSVVVP